MSDEIVVEFKVKDLFLEIKRDLDEIKNKIQQKADRVELERIESEVNELKQKQAAKAAVDDLIAVAADTRKQWVGLIVTGLLGLVSISIHIARLLLHQ